MVLVAEREHTFFRAAFFFVATRSTECRIKAILVQSGFQRIGFHDLRVLFAVVQGVNVQTRAFFIDVHEKFQAQLLAHKLITEGDHVLELPRRIDMQQRKGRLGRIKRFHGQMQHDR